MLIFFFSNRRRHTRYWRDWSSDVFFRSGAKPWLRATLAVLGSMSVQGAVIHWVADHRRHHTFTDEEGDPHSPHTHGGEGWRGVLSGLWHSHMGWLFEDDHTSARRYAPDLRKDPVIRTIDKL